MRILLLGLVVFCLAGCGEKNLLLPNVSSEQHPTETGTIKIPQNPISILDPSGSGSYGYIIISKDTEKEIVQIHHKQGEGNILSFKNIDSKNVHVMVTFPAPHSGNLRWAQVILPDGTMDGPFGQNMSYELTQKGEYQLRFSENMMAGDPWSGDAIISIALTK